MPTITLVSSRHEICARLVKALGITIPIQKLVMELDCSNASVVRIYVKAPVDMPAMERFVGEIELIQVADVSVDDACNVTIVEGGK